MRKHYTTFNKAFFAKWQPRLLWCLNARVVRYWARWILRIHADVKPTQRIVELQPNSYTIFNSREGDTLNLTTDFRTHNKFSKRIYHAFKYVWWTMHFMDWLVFDRTERFNFNFGFRSLEFYPDPDPEATTVDGATYHQYGNNGVSTLSELRALSTSSHVWDSTVTMPTYIRMAFSIAGNWRAVGRAYTLFNTISLGASANVIAAQFSIQANIKYNHLGGEAHENSKTVVVETSPASNTSLVTSDYSQHVTAHGTSLGESGIQTSISLSTYTDITLNAAGIGLINKAGVSKLGFCNKWDFSNDEAGITWAANLFQGMSWYASDEAGTSTDPKLLVTYTLPVSAFRPNLIVF